MFLELCDELYLLLVDKLNDVNVKFRDSNLAHMTNSIPVIRKALTDLKALVIKHGFDTPESEIYFFKVIKPKFYALQIYYVELFTLENNKPPSAIEMLIAYYEGEVALNQRFFAQNKFMFEYYKLGMHQLDKAFFLRNAKDEDIVLPAIAELNSEFTTNGDYIFSKFNALERLNNELLQRIDALKGYPISTQTGTTFKLQWTGEAINVVELAYGIWLTGQLNHGNATISEIIAFFEEKFTIKIGWPYRRWTEISQRKQISTTKYIDQLKVAIDKRIDEELSLKRKKSKNNQLDL